MTSTQCPEASKYNSRKDIYTIKRYKYIWLYYLKFFFNLLNFEMIIHFSFHGKKLHLRNDWILIFPLFVMIPSHKVLAFNNCKDIDYCKYIFLILKATFKNVRKYFSLEIIEFLRIITSKYWNNQVRYINYKWKWFNPTDTTITLQDDWSKNHQALRYDSR